VPGVAFGSFRGLNSLLSSRLSLSIAESREGE